MSDNQQVCWHERKDVQVYSNAQGVTGRREICLDCNAVRNFVLCPVCKCLYDPKGAK